MLKKKERERKKIWSPKLDMANFEGSNYLQIRANFYIFIDILILCDCEWIP